MGKWVRLWNLYMVGWTHDVNLAGLRVGAPLGQLGHYWPNLGPFRIKSTEKVNEIGR